MKQKTSEINSLANKAIQLLKEKKLTISVAESITGGGFTYHLTSVPGASDVVMGGVVAYTIDVKCDSLDVSKDTIDSFGVVSKEVAIEMADGIRNKMKSSIGMGVTGFAGPSGGDKFAPVGRVYWGFATASGKDYLELNLTGNREEIRLQTIYKGLSFLLQKLQA